MGLGGGPRGAGETGDGPFRKAGGGLPCVTAAVCGVGQATPEHTVVSRHHPAGTEHVQKQSSRLKGTQCRMELSSQSCQAEKFLNSPEASDAFDAWTGG